MTPIVGLVQAARCQEYLGPVRVGRRRVRVFGQPGELVNVRPRRKGALPASGQDDRPDAGVRLHLADRPVQLPKQAPAQGVQHVRTVQRQDTHPVRSLYDQLLFWQRDNSSGARVAQLYERRSGRVNEGGRTQIHHIRHSRERRPLQTVIPAKAGIQNRKSQIGKGRLTAVNADPFHNNDNLERPRDSTHESPMPVATGAANHGNEPSGDSRQTP